MDRVARVKERLELVKLEAKRIGEAGPPCSSCRYFGKTCGNPVMYEQVFEPSTGKYEVDSVTSLSAARAVDGLCGPEAMLFEHKPVVARYSENLVYGVSSTFDTLAKIIGGLTLWLLAAFLLLYLNYLYLS